MALPVRFFCVEDNRFGLIVEDLRIRRHNQVSTDQHAAWMSPLPLPAGQPGIVYWGGFGADENSLFFRPPSMHQLQACGIAYSHLSICLPDKAIGGLCPFENNIGSMLSYPRKKTTVDPHGFFFQQTDFHIDTCIFQDTDPLSIDLRKGI